LLCLISTNTVTWHKALPFIRYSNGIDLMMKFDRRTLMGAAAALASSSLMTADAQQTSDSVSAEELASAGPLGDKVLGSSTAPVTIYEYASLTCPHCAAFHADGFKFLKEKYIDTGKVKYVLRDFPLDPLAAAGFMLAHCAGDGKYYPMVDLIFSQQRSLVQTDKPVDVLLALARQAGFTQESFQACLRSSMSIQPRRFSSTAAGTRDHCRRRNSSASSSHCSKPEAPARRGRSIWGSGKAL
jgi:hypothetical protein